MWKRLAAQRLRDLSKRFPAVLIVGAKLVGKTTLARETFPKIAYCDLGEPSLRELFTRHPTFQTFQIERRAQPSLILDEAQSVPAVFTSLRSLIDKHRSRKGRILLGSAQPALVRQVSETGRKIGILELDPFPVSGVRTG